MAETVYIIGAGASVPYGLPSGGKLVDDIWQLTKNGTFTLRPGHSVPRREFLFEEDSVNLDQFANKLKSSNIKSIDLFLKFHPSLTKIGKIAIAASLMPLERAVSFGGNRDWLSYLWNESGISSDFSNINKVAFITFNYDRIIEHFFHSSIVNSRESHPIPVTQMMRDLKIIHLHGMLGSNAPWEEQNSSTIEAENIREVVEGLNLFHEEDQRHILLKARQELSDCKRIVFLGFGYAKENLSKVFIHPLNSDKYDLNFVGGTGFDLQKGERERIASRTSGIIEFGGSDKDCLDFLRNHDAISEPYC